MQIKVAEFIRSQGLLSPGDHVTCAVSGGADSMALLWCMVLLREKFRITVSAAHFNHHLRGAESDRDEQFVRDFCAFHDIPLECGGGTIRPGAKGLEAAARDARYAFLSSLPGKIATAHTADDNAETVLMHLVRGTGLKGMGGISPKRGNLIRPMLTVTRREVEEFLEENFISHIEDSSNAQDDFLRNRIRHNVMPLLKQENPRFSENLSETAIHLREDEACLSGQLSDSDGNVETLRALPEALRYRALEKLLKEGGVREPEREHLLLADRLLYSDNPSASAQFPGGILFGRVYDKLSVIPQADAIPETILPEGTWIPIPGSGGQVIYQQAEEIYHDTRRIAFCPQGTVILRTRKAGDTITLNGGTKSLKKLFIDKKIPAHMRDHIPIIADDGGVIAVLGIGGNLSRMTKDLPAMEVWFQNPEYK